MLVRLPQLEGIDLNRFQFDYDLTMMVFFLGPDGQVYGRYGGRDGEDPEARLSLAGLRYAMQAALRTHERSEKTPVAKIVERPKFIRDLVGGRRDCVHCHQINEMQHAALKRQGRWTRDHLWRYPLPDNLGIVLKIDQGDVVERVTRDSPAAKIGIRPGDVIERLAGHPIHSLADAQFALDGAPKSGTLEVVWRHQSKTHRGQLTLSEGWRRTDLSWRRSLQWVVPSARLNGRDLKPQERTSRGLTAKQLAFWEGYPISKEAKAAGVREGDIILGFDGKKLDMTAYQFLSYVRAKYLVDDQVTVDVLRDNKRLKLSMKLR